MFEEALLPILINLEIESLVKAMDDDEDDEKKEFADFAGICTTEHQDAQGDILDQPSINWDYFLQHGKFDWEHGKDPDDIIGYPTAIHKGMSYMGKPATGVEGRLVLAQPKARRAYRLMKSFAKAPGENKIGFSVFGGGRRDPLNPRRLCKAMFSRVALTATPVNPFTAVTIIKAAGFPVVPPVSNLTEEELLVVVRSVLGPNTPDSVAREIFRTARLLDGNVR